MPQRLSAQINRHQPQNHHHECHPREHCVNIVHRLGDNHIACCCSTHDVAPLVQAKARTTNDSYSFESTKLSCRTFCTRGPSRRPNELSGSTESTMNLPRNVPSLSSTTLNSIPFSTLLVEPSEIVA